ncbi:glutathione S-transferase family protein [Arenicella xantha]|uniref:Glutathione S-transferase n=1 Tax=Arenicella xantha TaxID=644221 RepID=A0A395JHT9_9GAMM|nr:glutathione S-transferase N-terminal domain-containing protein [Arenicella xantha]RBP49149.1 glutathione S-transferase [Arenicella xantha]
MSNRTLYIFSISHYCEKARWAMDYLGLDYDVQPLMPGKHSVVAKSLGLARGSMPFLRLPEQVIQGSDKIVDWADSVTSSGRSLQSDAQLACDIEQRLDDLVGVHVRRHYYSEALVEHPSIVLPVFLRGLSWLDKIKLRMAWPMICKRMIKLMDLGSKQGQESLEIVQRELDWLDGLLSDGRQFLAGGSELSRADITAASLLAPYVLPPEHSQSMYVKLPPRLAQTADQWRSRPIMQKVLSFYAQFR